MFPLVGCCTLSTISRQVLLLPFTAAEPFRVEKDKLSQKADLKGKKGILKERFFINSAKMAGKEFQRQGMCLPSTQF